MSGQVAATGAGPTSAPSLASTHEALCEAERRLDLLQHLVCGWCAWPIIRFEVSLRLARPFYDPSPPLSRAARLRLAVAGLPAMATARRARYLIKTYSSGLAEQVGERFWDIWFDDVVTAAGSTFKIEVPNNAHFAERSRRAATPRDLSSPTLELCAGLLARLPPDPEVSAAADALAAVLRREFGMNDVDERWVLVRLQRFVAGTRVYRSLLRRVRPEVVLVADTMEHAVVAASRAEGTLVVELQHGVSDRTHAGYGWSDYAAPYRDRLPLPHRLLLHGEHWKRELAHGGFWEDSQLRVVGSPRIDRYRKLAAQGRPVEGPVVVFTTQGLETPRVTAFLADSLAAVLPRAGFRLVVKLHPLYDADPMAYQAALGKFGDAIRIVKGNEAPSTFELLSRAHVHLSIASASHYDAIGLGVPTVILPFQSHESALPLHRAGHASLVRTPAELATLLEGWRELAPPAGLSDYYFKPGAVANILEEIGHAGGGQGIGPSRAMPR